MNRFLLSIFILSISFYNTFGQIGGQHSFEFIELAASPKIASLGGITPHSGQENLLSFTQNPSLLRANSYKEIQGSIMMMPAGIKHGGFGMNFKSSDLWNFGAGIRFIGYGNFTETAINGDVLGEFKAGEYALDLVASRKLTDKINIGVNLKPMYSNLKDYSAFAIATDVGFSYVSDSAAYTEMGLVAKNIGVIAKQYHSDSDESLPFDLQFGFSQRFKHLPFRINVVIHHLYTWDIRYDNPNTQQNTSIFGEEESTKEKKYILDKAFRHFNFGGELYIGKNIRLRFGYSHLKRQELAFTNKKGLAGFSLGAGIRIKMFKFDYSFSSYNTAGGLHGIGISTNLKNFKKN